MNCQQILIHFGELSTKGGNRKLFINKLGSNIRHALKAFPAVVVTSDHDHIYVELNGEDAERIAAILVEIPGIQRLSFIRRVSKEISAIQAAALEMISEEKGKTFKVDAKRADKTYPLDSYGIARAVGGYILSKTDWKVDVHNPDVHVQVDVRREEAFVSCKTVVGAGGYPLGMNGKAMLLLSGGIDSPVAAYALLRRGIRIECVHFASPPYTSMAVLDKLEDIIGKLSVYQEDIKLNIVPFTKLQEAIYENVDEPYCITIMRRMMVRIAVALAEKEHCLALATGESVGQVASQTLDSMVAINDVTNFPILRPLATSDKLSIIATAKRIDTYEISIRPYQDCCTIFAPKAPKTKPKISECERYESRFDWKGLVDECVEKVEQVLYVGGKKKQFEN